MGAEKLWEFVAHQPAVNCVHIGRQQGLVVTGGDDKKVKIWAVHNTTPIMTLSGHVSGVSCCLFDPAEEMIIAGAQNGSIKLWDLHRGVVYQTFTGHLSEVCSVSFHIYGDNYASGSADTNVKVWDVRQKRCCSTYKGHTKHVNQVRFSPDGKMLLSGCEDGTVRLWELRTTRCIHEFTHHNKPINDTTFHPRDVVIITASNDRTVQLYDADTYTNMGTTQPEATPPKVVAFPGEDGPDVLLAAYADGLRAISCDPVQVVGFTECAWTRVSDIVCRGNSVLGCSYYQTHVGLWRCDVPDIQVNTNALQASQRLSGHFQQRKHQSHDGAHYHTPQPDNSSPTYKPRIGNSSVQSANRHNKVRAALQADLGYNNATSSEQQYYQQNESDNYYSTETRDTQSASNYNQFESPSQQQQDLAQADDKYKHNNYTSTSQQHSGTSNQESSGRKFKNFLSGQVVDVGFGQQGAPDDQGNDKTSSGLVTGFKKKSEKGNAAHQQATNNAVASDIAQDCFGPAPDKSAHQRQREQWKEGREGTSGSQNSENEGGSQAAEQLRSSYDHGVLSLMSDFKLSDKPTKTKEQRNSGQNENGNGVGSGSVNGVQQFAVLPGQRFSSKYQTQKVDSHGSEQQGNHGPQQGKVIADAVQGCDTSLQPTISHRSSSTGRHNSQSQMDLQSPTRPSITQAQLIDGDRPRAKSVVSQNQGAGTGVGAAGNGVDLAAKFQQLQDDFADMQSTMNNVRNSRRVRGGAGVKGADSDAVVVTPSKGTGEGSGTVYNGVKATSSTSTDTNRTQADELASRSGTNARQSASATSLPATSASDQRARAVVHDKGIGAGGKGGLDGLSVYEGKIVSVNDQRLSSGAVGAMEVGGRSEGVVGWGGGAQDEVSGFVAKNKLQRDHGVSKQDASVGPVNGGKPAMFDHGHGVRQIGVDQQQSKGQVHDVEHRSIGTAVGGSLLTNVDISALDRRGGERLGGGNDREWGPGRYGQQAVERHDGGYGTGNQGVGQRNSRGVGGRGLNHGGGSGEELVYLLSSEHDNMVDTLEKRLSDMQTISTLWSEDPMCALSTLPTFADPTLTADVTHTLTTHSHTQQFVTLDTTPTLLTLITPLLDQHSTPRQQSRALHVVHYVMQALGSVIKDTLNAPPGGGMGVDLKFEERRGKCVACVEVLRGLRGKVRMVKPSENIDRRLLQEVGRMISAF